jgi:dolichol-phosphate mannosyltransferase
MTRKLVSIITPVFNEEENLDYYYREMKKATDALADRYDFEFVFTDNASTDSTFERLSAMAAQDRRIRVFSFSKNFGYQKSIATGYAKAKGVCAIEYDCDLQDPPEMLGQFLGEWEKGYQIVYGVRVTRKEGRVVTLLRKLFYRVINAVSEHNLPTDAGDFMLIDRVILDLLARNTDQTPYLRGTIFSFGFKRKGLPYDRRARVHGTTKFPFRKMFALAMDGIISQSIIPLRIASYTAIIVAFLAVMLSLYYIISKMFFSIDLPTGLTTTIALILFSLSLNAFFLGIIGEYLMRIYAQVRNRPVTIIAKSIDAP